MTLNELFARFDKLAAVRVLRLRDSANRDAHTALLGAFGAAVAEEVALKVVGQVCPMIRRVMVVLHLLPSRRITV